MLLSKFILPKGYPITNIWCLKYSVLKEPGRRMKKNMQLILQMRGLIQTGSSIIGYLVFIKAFFSPLQPKSRPVRLR